MKATPSFGAFFEFGWARDGCEVTAPGVEPTLLWPQSDLANWLVVKKMRATCADPCACALLAGPAGNGESAPREARTPDLEVNSLTL